VCLQLLVRIYVVIVCLILMRPVETNRPQLLRRTKRKKVERGSEREERVRVITETEREGARERGSQVKSAQRGSEGDK
jgi:hypothetical protein